MRLVLLDGRDMLTREALHHRLRQAFDFPEYYGNNLDALQDCLSEAHDVQVCFTQAGVMLASLGDYGRQALALLEEAAQAQPRFKLLIRR